MNLDFIPFAVPDVGEAEALAVADVIRSGWITSGPEMRAFERSFEQFVGQGVQAVAVNSATAGLHLALEALGIGPGDEVLVPTWTFTATAEVVKHVGATPVLVDVDPLTLNIDLESVEANLTNATRAVIPVHFAGAPVEVGQLRSRLGDRRIFIVEDAAHALPASSASGVVGNCAHSDATVFSFYATKTLTTSEGGMITTRQERVADRCRVMRLHGIDRDAFDRYKSSRPAWAYDVIAPGFKYNMPDTAAAMGRVQLRRMHAMRARRQHIAEYYNQHLADLGLELPPAVAAGTVHAWHLYVMRIPEAFRLSRDSFIEEMANQGVGTSVHFIPLHQHTYWKRYARNGTHHLPSATRQASRVVSLPLSSRLADAEIARVVAAVREVAMDATNA